jgi:hypothetical protein
MRLVFQKGFPAAPQANESISPKFRILLVYPVYLLSYCRQML